MNIEFLSIGDTTTDAFIDLEAANVQNNKLCVEFGSKIPYKDAVIIHGVGNAANAAVCASRLSLKSSIITSLGDDDRGKSAINIWKSELVDTSMVNIYKNFKTNYHFVLRHKAERTILIKHEKYPYTFKEPKYPPKMIYLTSLHENTIEFQNDIAEYAKENDVMLVFQPGTFQILSGTDKLSNVYKNTFLFFANKQEYQQILKNNSSDEKELLLEMSKLGPKYLVLTDGPNGIYAFDNKNFYHVPQYKDPKPPVDRTGAGDAFSATVSSFMLKGSTFKESLLFGPINSMSVVQHIGAQTGLLSTTDIYKLLSNADKDYIIKNI